jgi:hypothetical protein
MSKTNRREFLINAAPFAAVPLILPAFASQLGASPANSSLALPATSMQGDWRFCDKCNALFYNGFDGYGRCPAGGGHNPQGYNFFLPHGSLTDLPENPRAQVNWRYCDKCFGMFWDGIPDKGRCPVGGGHNAQGMRFRLPHDLPSNADAQAGWRFCQKCKIMFYDGSANKGKCPAGGGHLAQGYEFVLPHGAAPDIHVSANLTTAGWAPISGQMDITANQNGDCVFWGHVHNSGFPNIRYSLAAVLTTPSGQAFGFGVNGHRVDGTETVNGRNRDHIWNQPKNDPSIKQNWNQVVQGTLSWHLVASSTLKSNIEDFMDNMAKEALNKIAQEMNRPTASKVARTYMHLILML